VVRHDAERSSRARDERDRDPALAIERRSPHSRLAREIERRFARSRTPIRRATFAVEGGRVHVLLMRTSGAMHLIAVCPPRLRAAVEAALAQARYALARSGIAFAADVREGR